MINISHIILDIDGTLLSDKELIDFSTVFTEMQKLSIYFKKRNISTVFATGRSLSEVKSIDNIIDIFSPLAIITNCGAELYVKTERDYIKNMSYENKIQKLYNSFDRYSIEKRLLQLGLLTLQEDKRQFPFKISFYIEPIKFEVLFNEFKKMDLKGINMLLSFSTRSDDRHYVDFQHEKVTKFSAIEHFLDELNILHESIVYIGDNGNDIPCLFGFPNSAMIKSNLYELEKLYPSLDWERIFTIEKYGPKNILKYLKGQKI